LIHRAYSLPPSLPPSLLPSFLPFSQRYSLLVVISGVVLSNLFSLALGHPALLDEAREHVSSEAEERHPLFIRMHTMASYMLLVLSLFQWPCFYLAAVVYPNDNGRQAGREGGRERRKARRRSSHGKIWEETLKIVNVHAHLHTSPPPSLPPLPHHTQPLPPFSSSSSRWAASSSPSSSSLSTCDGNKLI